MKKPLIVIGIAAAAMSAIAFGAPLASAHESGQSHPHVAPVVDPGPPPGCDSSVKERMDWAARKSQFVHKPGDARGLLAGIWVHMRVCEGEEFFMPNGKLRGPKEPGVVPSVGIPAITVVKMDEEPTRKKGSARRPRSHGSCSTSSIDPSAGDGNLLFSSSGITCTNAVPLRRQYHEVKRRYDSTGTIVSHRYYGFDCCVTSTSRVLNDIGSCHYNSVFRTLGYWGRYHDGSWLDTATISPNWVSLTSAQCNQA